MGEALISVKSRWDSQMIVLLTCCIVVDYENMARLSS